MIGTSLSHYRILSRLGEGGMGEVYLAEDTVLHRKVAIKLLRPEVADAAAARRLIREAQSAAALDHPHICAIHEISDEGGRSFIVMQYIEGETLADRLERAPLEIPEALELAIPIADALAEAHRHGIVHRDIKPQNIMITPRRQVKVMDFGLAKPVEGPTATEAHTVTSLTQPGAIAGTVRYMSPEQARGDKRLDGRSDVFSYGVVLYEMLTGRQPFVAGSPAETLSAILTRDPPPVGRFQASASPELERIVGKALRKDREERYQDIKDLRLDLEALREELDFKARLERSASSDRAARPAETAGAGTRLLPTAVGAPRGRWLLPAAIGIGISGAGIGVYAHRSSLAWAEASLPRVQQLARDGDYASAYDLAVRIRRYRPEDPELKRLMTVVSDDLSASTEPPGAEILLSRFEGSEEDRPRSSLGRTPLNHAAIARGDYILRFELAGHEPFERSISSAIGRSEFTYFSPAIQVAVRLLETGKVPPRMTPIPGGRYKLVGYGQPTQAEAQLGDYFLDRYEVSNRDYQQFVTAQGYRHPEYWKQPFINDGRLLTADQAMRLFVDRTGLPGPRNWSGGSPPEGQLDHPVTGVTWYEAAAYAAFRGRTLPTIYQWEKAARDGTFVISSEIVMPWGVARGPRGSWHANFEGNATVPVDRFAFGMSPYGCYNMAGNVSEWVLNETSTGFVTAGGSWGDPPYIFGDYGTRSGFHSSDRLGFRCALTAPGVAGDQGGAKIGAEEQAPVYPRSSEVSFNAWLSHYRYDKTPLDARIEESAETPDWKRDKITYVGASGERTWAYLYLPRSARPPFQVIQFVPGSGAYRAQPANEFVENGRLSGHIKAGRGIFVVTLRGYTGREWPASRKRPEPGSVGSRDETVQDSIDLRRGIDYLETRPEIDAKRLAFMNVSIAYQGIIFSAVEPRYRSVILMAGGLYRSDAEYVAEANPINFAPHIKPPKLMLNGRWDEDFAFKTDAEPLFKLLSEPKRLELYDGGHVPPAELAVPIVNRWLDETLGPVRRD